MYFMYVCTYVWMDARISQACMYVIKHAVTQVCLFARAEKGVSPYMHLYTHVYCNV